MSGVEKVLLVLDGLILKVKVVGLCWVSWGLGKSVTAVTMTYDM